jgi:hypothetical protein
MIGGLPVADTLMGIVSSAHLEVKLVDIDPLLSNSSDSYVGLLEIF